MFTCCAANTDAGAETIDAVSAVEQKSAPPAKAAEVKVEEVKELPETGLNLTQKVILKRASATAPWGLKYEQVAATEALLITSLTEGAVQDYNKATDDFEFRKYDVIAGVDGETTLVKMLKVMNGPATQMELLMKRPATFKETVTRNDGESFGLVLKHTETGMTVTVKEIKDGSVKKSGANLQAGDIIAAINGEMGKGIELLSMLTNSRGTAELLFLRLM